jgi:hypothetical protein
MAMRLKRPQGCLVASQESFVKWVKSGVTHQKSVRPNRTRQLVGENMMTDDERNAWLASRKEAGLKIDPETAEVEWTYAQTLDPYGVYPLLPEEYCVGREYFARSPGDDVWVWFGDLPQATRNALWEKHKAKLAFPAGLFLPFRPRSPKDENGIDGVYGCEEEVIIVYEDCFVRMHIQQAPKLIEKMRAVLREIEADASEGGAAPRPHGDDQIPF